MPKRKKSGYVPGSQPPRHTQLERPMVFVGQVEGDKWEEHKKTQDAIRECRENLELIAVPIDPEDTTDGREVRQTAMRALLIVDVLEKALEADNIYAGLRHALRAAMEAVKVERAAQEQRRKVAAMGGKGTAKFTPENEPLVRRLVDEETSPRVRPTAICKRVSKRLAEEYDMDLSWRTIYNKLFSKPKSDDA